MSHDTAQTVLAMCAIAGYLPAQGAPTRGVHFWTAITFYVTCLVGGFAGMATS